VILSAAATTCSRGATIYVRVANLFNGRRFLIKVGNPLPAITFLIATIAKACNYLYLI
jgi:hypothetical protein